MTCVRHIIYVRQIEQVRLTSEGYNACKTSKTINRSKTNKTNKIHNR